MKIILFTAYGITNIPALATARYLRDFQKGTRFYIYAYTGEGKKYKRVPLHIYEKQTEINSAYGDKYDFVSLKDLGPEHNTPTRYPEEDKNFFNIAQIIDVEKNPDFIHIVENLPENFRHALRVVDIPSGTAYRILDYDGAEYIEYRDEIKWEIAD